MNSDQRARLIELLESLDTDKMGQRAVAARQIADLRIEIGKPWSDLLIGKPGGHGQPAATPMADWQRRCADVLNSARPGDVLTMTRDEQGNPVLASGRQSAIPQPAEEKPLAAKIAKVFELHSGKMNAWQAGFLEDMLGKARRGSSLTPSQEAKLAQVLNELENPTPKPARKAFGAWQ